MEFIVMMALQGVRISPDPGLEVEGLSYDFDPIGRTLRLDPELSLLEVADVCQALFPLDGQAHKG